MVSVSEATKDSPEVGVGVYGAPSMDVARPKPTDGGSETLAVVNPNALAVVVADRREEEVHGVHNMRY